MTMCKTGRKTASIHRALALGSALAGAAAMAQGVTFMSRSEASCGLLPVSMVVADLNGDGIADLVCVYTGSITLGVPSAIHVGLGNGDGTFRSVGSPDPPVPTLPTSLAVGDFNGDGVPDLAVANSVSSEVSVLLGTGDGTFQPARSFPVGSSPYSVAVGDFNGDGAADLVLANASTNDVSVLLGNGDGSFGTATRFGVGAGPRSVVVGKFRGPDMPDDLAVANSSSNDVSVLLGNGDGSFEAPQTFVVGGGPISVTVGDFNGDEAADLAVANSLSNDVSVLLGNGDGSFQPAVSFAVGRTPRSVAAGKFRGAGMPDDLAVANRDSTSVSLLLSQGDGSFEEAHNFDADRHPIQVAWGELRRGLLDLAVVNEGEGIPPRFFGGASLLFSNGAGSFQEPQRFATAPGPHSLAVGDFNGDGLPDVALSNPTGTVSVVLGNGDGTFQPAVDFPAGSSLQSIVVGKLRGPKMPDDLVLKDGANVKVLLGNGDGTFQAPLNTLVGPLNALALGDFDNDGLLDLAVAQGSTHTVAVLLGNGDGTFQAPRPVAVGQFPSHLAAGDFNGDGVLDLAVADSDFYSFYVWILLGQGDGSFGPPARFEPGFYSPSFVAVGDLDGDGVLDLAVITDLRHIPVSLFEASELIGNGDGSFRIGGSFSAPAPRRGLVVAKLAGPEAPDVLAVPVPADNEVLVATFYGITTLRTFGGGAEAVGDFDGDGRLDLIFSTDSGFAVLFNNTPQ